MWCARKVLLIPGKWKRCAVRSVSRRLWSCSRTTMKCQSCRTRTAQLEPSPSPAPSCPCHFLIAHNFFCYRNVIATFRPSKRPDQQYDSHSTGFNHPPHHDIAYRLPHSPHLFKSSHSPPTRRSTQDTDTLPSASASTVPATTTERIPAPPPAAPWVVPNFPSPSFTRQHVPTMMRQHRHNRVPI